MTDERSAPPDQQQQQQRRTPRSSSPAKRLHSDMTMADDNMDLDAPASTRRNSGQASPRGSKPAATTASSQRSARATSVEMADAPNNSGSSETDLSNADSSVTSVDAAQQVDLPSLDEQVAKVMVMMHAPLQERQEGYIISEKWLERVWARTSENSGRPHEFNKEATQGPIGPVDNSGLVDVDALQDELMDQRGEDFLPLSKAVQLAQDFEILPAKAWESVVSWYGLKEGTPVIRRYAQNTVPDKSSENIEYELHPPILTVRKVRRAPHTTTESSKRAERLVASRYESYVSFLEAAKKAAGIDLNNKVRVWRILNTAPTDASQQTQPSGMLTPDASPRGGSPAVSSNNQLSTLAMDVASFSNLTFGTERELVTGKDEKENEQCNASLTLDGAGLTQDQTIVLEEHDEKGEYVSDASKTTNKNKNGTQSKGVNSTTNSGRSTPTGGPLTRTKARNGKVRGHVGLTNLGNTCYMNSALQCLRSVEELSLYFLSNKWRAEINSDNPIGHNGAIAKVYAGLLANIYDTGAVSSFSPKNFKQTLGKANSLFSGYGQQDSQEFVSWLVDALHEDLNRVHKKPYRENPDSDDNTFRDPEAIRQLGETYRDNHKARNNSVAMDLFSGFYKNTMICPECEKVSITFDPYSQLTLQLPIEQTWTHTVTYVPLHGKPYQLEVDIDKNASIKALKDYVGKRFGNIPANRLMASEVHGHKFYRHLEDHLSIAESNIGIRDDIWVYELDMVPSNWPPLKKKGARYRSILSHGSSDEDIPESRSPLHDRVVIPVFNRGPNMSSYRSNNYSMALWPFFIVLDREEAKDNDTILRKVLAKVAQMTTRPILSEISESPSDPSGSNSDVVVTTEEDASPNGDPRVKDGSIAGEDLVEVTMADPAQTPEKDTTGHPLTPGVLQSDTDIPPACRQLFEMKHSRRSNEMVTTGWNTVDHSKSLEAISKRIRVPTTPESSQSSPAGSEGSSSDEDAETPQSVDIDVDAAIEQATASSDEEMQSSEPAFARGGRQNNKKSKRMRKQERKQERKHKNNKNFKHKKNRVPEQPSYMDDSDDTDESLVRMGEALVLEWEPSAFDALFGGSSSNDDRGRDALKLVETFEDPEIAEKKSRRAARRKHGITLDDCFSETSKSEVLSEDNAWYCNRCKELRRATKTLEIWTVPDILIIHLKRFSGHRSFRDKVDELVDFPVEGLDLSGKVGFPEDKDLKYDLFAVDNHYGGLGGGHYTATARNFFDGQWYDYNDSIVSRCSSGEKAVTRAAYLLFYRRRTPHPLGPPSLQQLVKNPLGSEDEEDDEEDATRSRTRDSEAGNGQRLDGLSRNGSSSASTAGTGVAVGAAALRGAGSQHSARGSTLKNVAGAGSLSDDEDLPPYADGLLEHDEGFVDADEYTGMMDYRSGGLAVDEPSWSFGALSTTNLGDRQHDDDDDDDVASDMPDLGSTGEPDNRLMEDFGDDLQHPGTSTPVDDSMDNIHPLLGGEDGDDDVHEIRVAGTKQYSP